MKRESIRIITGLLSVILSANICFAGDISSAIEAYKSGNYENCIATMKAIVKNDPTSALGYYYLALAYSKTGKSFLAVQNYNKVIALNSDETLTALAKEGKEKIGGKNLVKIETQIEDIEDDYNPIFNDSVVEQATVKKDSEKELKTTKVIKSSDFSQQNKQTEKYQSEETGMPTNEEILNAINILRRAGLLQNGGAALTGNTQQPQQMQNIPPMDSRTQQMQSMLMMMNGNNGYNNNNMMQMIPYMNNGGKIDPQVMQMMLMNQMMPNFSSGNNNNGY